MQWIAVICCLLILQKWAGLHQRSFRQSQCKHHRFDPVSSTLARKAASEPSCRLRRFTGSLLLTWIQLSIKSAPSPGAYLPQAYTRRRWSEAAPDCCIRVSSTRQMTRNVDGCPPLWELMGETWTICFDNENSLFTARCIAQYWDCMLSVRLSVCNVGGSGSHRLEIFETNCTDT